MNKGFLSTTPDWTIGRYVLDKIGDVLDASISVIRAIRGIVDRASGDEETIYSIADVVGLLHDLRSQIDSAEKILKPVKHLFLLGTNDASYTPSSIAKVIRHSVSGRSAVEALIHLAQAIENKALRSSEGQRVDFLDLDLALKVWCDAKPTLASFDLNFLDELRAMIFIESLHADLHAGGGADVRNAWIFAPWLFRKWEGPPSSSFKMPKVHPAVVSEKVRQSIRPQWRKLLPDAVATFNHLSEIVVQQMSREAKTSTEAREIQDTLDQAGDEIYMPAITIWVAGEELEMPFPSILAIAEAEEGYEAWWWDKLASAKLEADAILSKAIGSEAQNKVPPVNRTVTKESGIPIREIDEPHLRVLIAMWKRQTWLRTIASFDDQKPAGRNVIPNLLRELKVWGLVEPVQKGEKKRIKWRITLAGIQKVEDIGEQERKRLLP